MNIIYNTAISLYAAAVRIASLRNRKAGLMVRGQRRTCDVLRQKAASGTSYVWMHAASLGEFEQGRPLLDMIRRNMPDKKILLTFFSPSGYEVRKGYDGADIVCYLPFDTPRRVRRFLDAVRIEKAIFVKYEFWGNYLQELHRRRIPTYIISAIFRPSQPFFKWYGGMFRRMLGCYDGIFVQDEESRKLLESIGVRDARVFGDTRFDRVSDILDHPKELPVVEAFSRGSFTLFAGSSWEPDEAFLIPYFNRTPDIKMVIAPHVISPSHIAAIESRLTRPCIRYSKATPESAAQADCLIIDCYGILSHSYRFATVAYVGGGFGVGIHNINEAAVFGIPVVFGPNYGKFKEARDLTALDGAIAISSGDEYAKVMQGMLDDRQLLARRGRIAGHYIEEHIGATRRVYDSIFSKQAEIYKP